MRSAKVQGQSNLNAPSHAICLEPVPPGNSKLRIRLRRPRCLVWRLSPEEQPQVHTYWIGTIICFQVY